MANYKANVTAGFFAIVKKTADETVNNSNTMQDDDHLKFTPNINKTYMIEMDLWVSAVTGSLWKYTFDIPTGAVGINLDGAVTGNVAIATVDAEATHGIGGVVDAISHMKILARIIMSTTAGAITFKWAQTTAEAEDTKILKGSIMKVIEI